MDALEVGRQLLRKSGGTRESDRSDVLGVGLFHDSSKTSCKVGTLSPDGNFVTIFWDDDDAVALGKDGLGSRTNEETLLGLGQCQLDGREGGGQIVDCLFDGVNCTADGLALSVDSDFSGRRVERKVDFFTSSCEESGPAGYDEGEDVGRNIADALGGLADLGSDVLLDQNLSLENRGLGASECDGDDWFVVVVIGLRGVGAGAVGGLFALGNVDSDVRLFTNLVQIRS